MKQNESELTESQSKDETQDGGNLFFFKYDKLAECAIFGSQLSMMLMGKTKVDFSFLAAVYLFW
ncbi:MAG: hypothetical protein GH152_00200 [Dehalococcoidia bacterium]|nr:hypothetical protein [Dehalococcoidia bacterium]